MKNKLKKRIRSRVGETITEVLISVLIAAFALSLLAGMIFAAKHLVDSSKEATKDYILAENVLAAQPNDSDLVGAGAVTVSGKLTGNSRSTPVHPVIVIFSRNN